MNRLTKDLNTPHDDTTYADVVANCCDKENIVLTKLKHYEDIEEELGIDLITLFRALKKGIFVAYDSSFGMANKPKIKITKDTATGICYRNKKWYIQEDETLIKDYGKTWSLDKKILTKEVLENDN